MLSRIMYFFSPENGKKHIGNFYMNKNTKRSKCSLLAFIKKNFDDMQYIKL